MFSPNWRCFWNTPIRRIYNGSQRKVRNWEQVHYEVFAKSFWREFPKLSTMGMTSLVRQALDDEAVFLYSAKIALLNHLIPSHLMQQYTFNAIVMMQSLPCIRLGGCVLLAF